VFAHGDGGVESLDARVFDERGCARAQRVVRGGHGECVDAQVRADVLFGVERGGHAGVHDD